MRLLTQLEALLANATTAKQRYVLLGRSGCLSRKSRSRRAHVEGLLNVWSAGYDAGSAHQPLPGHPPVEQGIVQSLRDAGYLSERGLAMSQQWPAEWSVVERLGRDASRGPLRRWLHRLITTFPRRRNH